MKLSPLIHQFFDEYLPSIRGVSQQTIKAYRDAFRLFLPFAASYNSIKIKSLRVEHIQTELLVPFLEDLQNNRKNAVKTRNQRLAALKSFAKMIRFATRISRRSQTPFLIFPRSVSRRGLLDSFIRMRY